MKVICDFKTSTWKIGDDGPNKLSDKELSERFQNVLKEQVAVALDAGSFPNKIILATSNQACSLCVLKALLKILKDEGISQIELIPFMVVLPDKIELGNVWNTYKSKLPKNMKIKIIESVEDKRRTVKDESKTKEIQEDAVAEAIEEGAQPRSRKRKRAEVNGLSEDDLELRRRKLSGNTLTNHIEVASSKLEDSPSEVDFNLSGEEVGLLQQFTIPESQTVELKQQLIESEQRCEMANVLITTSRQENEELIQQHKKLQSQSAVAITELKEKLAESQRQLEESQSQSTGVITENRKLRERLVDSQRQFSMVDAQNVQLKRQLEESQSQSAVAFAKNQESQKQFAKLDQQFEKLKQENERLTQEFVSFVSGHYDILRTLKKNRPEITAQAQQLLQRSHQSPKPTSPTPPIAVVPIRSEKDPLQQSQQSQQSSATKNIAAPPLKFHQSSMLAPPTPPIAVVPIRSEKDPLQQSQQSQQSSATKNIAAPPLKFHQSSMLAPPTPPIAVVPIRLEKDSLQQSQQSQQSAATKNTAVSPSLRNR